MKLSSVVYHDTTAEHRSRWTDEMRRAVSEIQRLYHDKVDIINSQLNSSYSLKVPHHTRHFSILLAQSSCLHRGAAQRV